MRSFALLLVLALAGCGDQEKPAPRATIEMPEPAPADFGSSDPGGAVSHHDVIAEWRIDARDPNRIDSGSRREVLRSDHPLRDHTLGQIAFKPNARPGGVDYGLLDIGVGDGGDMYTVRGEIDQMRSA